MFTTFICTDLIKRLDQKNLKNKNNNLYKNPLKQLK